MHVELRDLGHEVTIELFSNPDELIENVERLRPQLILSPMLTKVIPEAIWRKYVCIILHPGIVGDRGASSLDWAILENQQVWGVTALQAAAQMDAGDIWASQEFLMRPASKGSLYRHEVVEAAVKALLHAVERFAQQDYDPQPLDYERPTTRGTWHPFMRQEDHRIDWRAPTASILRIIRASDNQPGTLDRIFGQEYYLYGAHNEHELRGEPGEILAKRHGAICRATGDGALWISHLKAKSDNLKLPAVSALGKAAGAIPHSTPNPMDAPDQTYRDICYEEAGQVGFLHFDFYGGAMGVDHCQRLAEEISRALKRDTRVLVLMGGEDFFSNGIHLNLIEAAPSPADESWANLNAMNDVVKTVLLAQSHLIVAALQGNAAAGGVALAAAADVVWARQGVILNPHYRKMGLYGSEYWTYVLPRRVGVAWAERLTTDCLPIGSRQAQEIGLIDEYFGANLCQFRHWVSARAQELTSSAGAAGVARRLAEKRASRQRDEALKPLAQYRAEELEKMHQIFYNPDQPYHRKRAEFVWKTA
jgi:putative two-component system hydrogenase maturation factor HypX/HoxX